MRAISRKGIYALSSLAKSFGVVLLQIISGKRNTSYYGTYENLSILEYAFELWLEGQGMEFIDPSLDDSTSSCKLLQCLQVALLCVQENPVDRPSMLEVSSMLKNEMEAIRLPKRPAFSIKKNEKHEDGSSQQEKFSINDASFTQMAPR
ncbi:hypothetical protein L6164_014226 [Bauhinia variegata]|uniref:Uncharacterized protein n=1 Tax=Bauhinia variegata TaxID=167791 RepID=A0ACB9NHW6_BAUVA|nr:hypothetical protein L6164_014226 [Bauhinia variegata]